MEEDNVFVLEQMVAESFDVEVVVFVVIELQLRQLCEVLDCLLALQM